MMLILVVADVVVAPIVVGQPLPRKQNKIIVILIKNDSNSRHSTKEREVLSHLKTGMYSPSFEIRIA